MRKVTGDTPMRRSNVVARFPKDEEELIRAVGHINARTRKENADKRRRPISLPTLETLNKLLKD